MKFIKTTFHVKSIAFFLSQMAYQLAMAGLSCYTSQYPFVIFENSNNKGGLNWVS